MDGILRKVLWTLLSSTLWKTAAPAEQNRTPPLFLHTPFICYFFFFFLKLENNRHRHQKGEKNTQLLYVEMRTRNGGVVGEVPLFFSFLRFHHGNADGLCVCIECES